MKFPKLFPRVPQFILSENKFLQSKCLKYNIRRVPELESHLEVVLPFVRLLVVQMKKFRAGEVKRPLGSTELGSGRRETVTDTPRLSCYL